MRAFLAIPLPPEIRQALAALQAQLADSRADVKWVEPENLHVTVKFLGEIDDETRRAVESAAGRVASAEPAFALAFGAVGAFPSMSAPRVVWVGLAEGAQAVARIAAGLERAGRAIGWRQEERPFSPHLTIGRVRSPRRRQQLTQALQRAACPHTTPSGVGAWIPPAPWGVTGVTLYQSELSSRGPRYTVLAECPLGH